MFFEGDAMESLILVRLDSKYCDYLRQFDKKVPYNYDKKDDVILIQKYKGNYYNVPNDNNELETSSY